MNIAAHVLAFAIAAPGLLAQVAVSKYLDHLPLYRQEAICPQRGGAQPHDPGRVDRRHQGVALQPLVDALRRELLTCPVLHADETPVAQLDPGRGQTQCAYLFAYAAAGGAAAAPPSSCSTTAPAAAASMRSASWATGAGC